MPNSIITVVTWARELRALQPEAGKDVVTMETDRKLRER